MKIVESPSKGSIIMIIAALAWAFGRARKLFLSVIISSRKDDRKMGKIRTWWAVVVVMAGLFLVMTMQVRADGDCPFGRPNCGCPTWNPYCQEEPAAVLGAGEKVVLPNNTAVYYHGYQQVPFVLTDPQTWFASPYRFSGTCDVYGNCSTWGDAGWGPYNVDGHYYSTYQGNSMEVYHYPWNTYWLPARPMTDY